MALRLSGMAAKNFALFVYAVLKDQKKTHGKTRLVRMLREQRPFKFFNIPTEHMREFATEAKTHGLLYVPIRNKQKADRIEVVVFADDASKVQRIFDNLGLDAVKAQAGEATIASVQEQEKQAPAAPAPGKTETVKTEQGEVEFEVGGFEDDFNIGPVQQDAAANFTSGREKEA
ncbi:PcfB family protein, partial [Hominenteromicrobium sp.]|uniref:PcfB family protein n=1 Tax=Hominenteromicrobium sp. TaxID=3073581 RepID=UPI003A8E3318